MASMKPLTIYKASAGAGKTFTLVVEYLCLLVNNPTCHDQILAVTFTNKATEEMKMRIIGQLYGISKQLPASDGYLNVIINRTGRTADDIRSRCTISLHHILHHYSSFHIQTIDAFFQVVFRNMARELDLPPNLRIDLNDRQVEEKAVDELINSLKSNSKILTWIREYIATNMQEDRSWNVISEIKRFGENIFRDYYKNNEAQLQQTLGNHKAFEAFRKQLVIIRDAAYTRWNSLARQMLESMEQYDYDNPDYYKYGTRGSVWSYIHKLQTMPSELSSTPANVQKFLDSPADSVKSDVAGNQIEHFACDILHPMLEDFEGMRGAIWHDYQSATLVLRNLNQLRLLHAIDGQVKEMNSEANRFQLSNTQSLLKAIIHDSDSPFIFEKIGAHLRYMMIDEFQDTSRTQWDNFKVLLLNNMADSTSRNLIVGDVKQSIYRWRGGDWQLLNNINREFATNDKDAEEILSNITLEHNYRSGERIVHFNNSFFKQAVKITSEELRNDGINDYEQLEKAYSNHSQKPIRKDDTGYIRIEFHSDDKESYEQNVLDSVVNYVDRLIDNGAQQNDIAILLRRNKHIELVADMFMQERPNLNVISGEAFRLDSSPAVNILVDALTVLIHPDDNLTRHTLAKTYTRYILSSKATDNEILLTTDINTRLPKRFVEDDKLHSLPLTDLVETLFDIFSLQKLSDQGAYICKFNDLLSNFVFDNSSDIQAFLNAWSDNLHNEKIQSDVVNGIRLLSIHKSKGLEFKHVIIPFCDWQIEQTSTIWCENITTPPYGALPVIPVRYSRRALMGTIFESAYKQEHLQNVVDNMNLLYVAFTRAEESLFVIGKKRNEKKGSKQTANSASSNDRSSVIAKVVDRLGKELPDSSVCEDSSKLTFEWGTLPPPSKKERESSTQSSYNVFDAVEGQHSILLQTFASSVAFRQSNKSRDYIHGDEDDEATPTTNYIMLGNVLHNVFAHIRTLDDVEPRLREMELEGILYDEELTAEAVRSRIKEALNHPEIRQWFSPRWTLFNEQTILLKTPGSSQPTEFRPDRVMTDGHNTIVVDFKFGKEHKEHEHQVANYMQLLRQMGYPAVRGYIWYVMRNKVTEVERTF